MAEFRFVLNTDVTVDNKMVLYSVSKVSWTYLYLSGRGVSEKVPAVGFCLGSGLFGSYNSD